MATYSSPVELYSALLEAWSPESSSHWTPDNPAAGHCSATSLIVQDVFGGEIVATNTPGGRHFYNILDGVRWDLTVSQFDQPIPFEDLPATRSQALADASPEAYAALRSRLGFQD